jgi:hypothetical protein
LLSPLWVVLGIEPSRWGSRRSPHKTGIDISKDAQITT